MGFLSDQIRNTKILIRARNVKRFDKSCDSYFSGLFYEAVRIGHDTASYVRVTGEWVTGKDLEDSSHGTTETIYHLPRQTEVKHEKSHYGQLASRLIFEPQTS